MVQIKQGIGNNVLLTITDRKGNVVLHETVKATDADTIATRILANLR
jgi:hypothetical protein